MGFDDSVEKRQFAGFVLAGCEGGRRRLPLLLRDGARFAEQTESA